MTALAAGLPRRGVPRRELALLTATIVVGVVVRVLYVVLTRHHAIVADQIEYDLEGRFIAAGRWFWSTAPFGIAHPSAWKAPGYPAWVGAWYALIGHHPTGVKLAQSILLGPATIVLTWLLARGLLGARIALVAAAVVAIYPLVWQWDGLLYSESLALPLTLAALVVVLGREPTPLRAAGAGALIGVNLLVRPTSVILLAGAVVAWWVAAGWRRGSVLAVLTVLLAVLVVAPWTYRNYRVEHGFLPISLQDGAAYGTFNRDSAHDPVYPYAWRPAPPSDADLLNRSRPVSDLTFRSRLDARALSYVRAHPASLAEAFFWNGLSRLWDVRRPAHALDEVHFEGRVRGVTVAGLAMYYVLLPLALIGLWRLRRRREIVLPVLAIAVAACVVFTVASGTRYRAPLEPLIVMLAAAALLVPARLRAQSP